MEGGEREVDQVEVAIAGGRGANVRGMKQCGMVSVLEAKREGGVG